MNRPNFTYPALMRRVAKQKPMQLCAHCLACSAEKKTEMVTLTCILHYTTTDLLLRFSLNCPPALHRYSAFKDILNKESQILATPTLQNTCSQVLNVTNVSLHILYLIAFFTRACHESVGFIQPYVGYLKPMKEAWRVDSEPWFEGSPNHGRLGV